MANTTEIFLIIFLIVIIETISISCVKGYHDGAGQTFMLLAIFGYSIVCYLLNKSLSYKDSMGMVNLLWSGMSVLAVSVVGVLLFKEKVSSYDMIAGSLIASGIMIFKYGLVHEMYG